MSKKEFDFRNTCESFMDYLQAEGAMAFLIAVNDESEVCATFAAPDDKAGEVGETIAKALFITMKRNPILREILMSALNDFE